MSKHVTSVPADRPSVSPLLDKYTPRIAVAAAAGKALWDAYKRLKAAQVYTITVNENDDVFLDLAEWILEHIPSVKRRSLEVRTSLHSAGDGMATPLDTTESRKREVKIRLLYDGARSQELTIYGHQVKVEVELGEYAAARSERLSLKPAKVVFEAGSPEARDAVIRLITEAAERRAVETADAPRLFLANPWGGYWRRRNDMPARDLDTVILPPGVKESFVDDLAGFFAAEAKYAELGLPWHRGYLFEGPPGTGKTSLARAAASHFNLDVYFLTISDVTEDATLHNLIAEVPARSMLLLEDIDVASSSHIRDDGLQRVSMAGLLNALDGIVTPHGLITVMTTNHVERLDPAIVRPGRVDHSIHVGHIDDEQLERLVRLAVGEHLNLPPVGEQQITAATIMTQVLQPNLNNPAAIPDAVAAVLAGKVD